MSNASWSTSADRQVINVHNHVGQLKSLPSSSSAIDVGAATINTTIPEIHTTIPEVDSHPPTADYDYKRPTYERVGQRVPAADDVIRHQTIISTSPSHQSAGELDDVLESRSRRETANVVVVRPLPTSVHAFNDDIKQRRSRQATVSSTPVVVKTGSDDDDAMRSRRTSGVRTDGGKKSALRKTSRSQSCDRHVSYSNTDTVYRCVLFTRFI